MVKVLDITEWLIDRLKLSFSVKTNVKVNLEEGVLRYTINRNLTNTVSSVSLPKIQKSAQPPIYGKIL